MSKANKALRTAMDKSAKVAKVLTDKQPEALRLADRLFSDASDRELLQQALDALIWTTGSDDFAETGKARVGAVKVLFPAIEALRARLAQPEPEQQLEWGEVS